MIGLEELNRGLAEYLAGKTGAAAFAGRAEGPVYPALAVELCEENTAILAGGRQIQREISAVVTCYPSRQRQREAGQALASRVLEAAAAGFTLCGRGFSPRELKTGKDGQERYQVRFTLEFCDLPEVSRRPASGERMERLSLRICRREEER